MSRPSSRRYRLALATLTLLSVALLVFAPRPSQALGPSITIGDIPRIIFQAIDKTAQKIGKAFKISGDIAFKSSLEILQARLLREVQTQLATVGPGQKPLFLTNPKKFFKNVSNAAAGDFIDDFSRGATGETGPGTSFSGARGKFLISRLLRAQAGQVVGGLTTQCKQDCDNSFSTDNLDVSDLEQMSAADFNSTFGPDKMRNIHEWNIVKVTYDTIGPGGTKSLADQDPDGTIAVCPDVTFDAAGYVWDIQVGATELADVLTKNDCYQGQLKAILNERAAAQAETNQCYQSCQAQGTAAANAISGFTATDIFSAVQNADPRKAPAALANALSLDKSDLGQFLTAAGAMTAKIQEVVTGEQTNLNPNVLPVTTKVSEEVKSPSSTASTLLGIPFIGQSGQFTYTGTSVADVLKGIASFLNSPVGKALANYFKSKCGLNPDLCKGPSNARSTIGQLVFGSGGPTGTAGAQLLYAKLGQAQITTGDPGRNEISITDQLTSNGLIDAQFRQAIEGTMTVKEALDQRLLDPQKTFGFDKNGVEPRDGYPYRALQYLRKFRVTPVGWELAAKYSQLFDHRDLSLGYLTSRYNICNQDPTPLVCSVGGAACSTAAEISTCTASSVCSIGGAACSTAAETTLCTNQGGTCVAKTAGTCVTKLPSGDHSVCTRGPKADQSCQQNSDCGVDESNATITCGASPYCGLVDPNWVLKAPQTYCRRQGAGEEIIAKEFVCDQNNVDATTGNVIPPGVTCGQDSDCKDNQAPNCVASTSNPRPDVGRWVIERNSDTCADAQSCIAENEDGSCQAFGYCVQERQQFKFDGTQCSAENSSCTAFVDPVGQQVAYLANTLDSRNCNADNAGCTQYCSTANYDPITQTCGGYCSTDSSKSCTTSAQCGVGTCINQTINFTGQVQQCQSSQVGCRQFLRTADGTNLLANSGFETFDQPIDGGFSANYAGWAKGLTLGASPVTASDPAFTANNTAAVRLTGAPSDTLTQVIYTGYDLYERSFTLSVRAKAQTACAATLTLEPNTAQDNRPRVPGNDQSTNIAVTTEWDTYDVTLSIPGTDQITFAPPAYDLKAGIRLDDCAANELLIDSAQLEESAGPSPYRDYGIVNAVYLNGQRQQCAVADVGCQTYTPLAGGSDINGQVRNSNRCSADKVGCATYQLEPITGVPPRSGGAVNVVIPQGKTCSAADVGCEEYTNLDEVAKGGEGKEYFKSVKQCLKPAQIKSPVESATYYTWVGDAKLGYVLRSYDLVKSNRDGAPCTSLKVGTVTDNPVCNDTDATVSAAQVNCSAAGDLAKNADCSQYYDSALNIYYRLRAKTVSITEDCHPYRNTIDQSDPAHQNDIYYLSTKENLTCGAAAAGCRAYTGNASGTTRQVFSDNFENNGTANWNGGAASNESVNLNGHSMLIDAAGASAAAVTTDKTLANQIFSGRTYLLTFTAAAESATSSTITAAFGRLNGNTFQPFNAGLANETTFPGTAIATWNDNITPKGPEWRNFTLGPLIADQDLTNAQLALRISGGSAYVDNVTLTEVNDHVYLISSTLPQCSSADVGCAAYRDRRGTTNYLTSFTRLCSEQVVGCEALIDTRNSTSPFAQTVKGVTTPADTIYTLVNNPAVYCPAAAKGCEAVGRPTYGPDQKLVSYLSQYLINDPDRHSQDLCENNELSCQVYTTADGTAAYFKDPGQRVCDYRTGGDGNGQWYITGTSQPCPIVTPPLVGRPVGPSCSPRCAGGDRDGRACTMLPASTNECPGGGVCAGDASRIGQIFDPVTQKFVTGQCTTNADCYSGVAGPNQNTCVYLAGSCPAEQNGCTEYRDPTDPAGCRSECPLSLSQGGSPDYVDGACRRTQCADGERAGQNCQNDLDCQDAVSVHTCVGGDQPSLGLPGCRPYYYLRQSLETNAGSCNGKVDAAIGCRPFNDTTNPALNFRGQ